MIIAISCQAITDPYEPNIRTFAEMTADGHIFMNGSNRKSSTKNMLTRFEILIKNLKVEPDAEEKSFIRAMIQASWDNFTRHHKNHIKLQDNFNIDIVTTVEEATSPDCRRVYIFTQAEGQKYIIA